MCIPFFVSLQNFNWFRQVSPRCKGKVKLTEISWDTKKGNTRLQVSLFQFISHYSPKIRVLILYHCNPIQTLHGTPLLGLPISSGARRRFCEMGFKVMCTGGAHEWRMCTLLGGSEGEPVWKEFDETFWTLPSFPPFFPPFLPPLSSPPLQPGPVIVKYQVTRHFYILFFYMQQVVGIILLIRVICLLFISEGGRHQNSNPASDEEVCSWWWGTWSEGKLNIRLQNTHAVYSWCFWAFWF